VSGYFRYGCPVKTVFSVRRKPLRVSDELRCMQGLYLPKDKVLKRFDGARLSRITWKIIRGLYFYHFKEFLPEGIKKDIRIVSPGEKPPPDFFDIIDEPTRGQYSGVFDYRFTDSLDHNFHYWALLLWDRIILITAFQYPACECNICVASQV